MANPLRVLIVEDNPADAELMVYELGKGGFAPTWKRVETEAEYLAALDPALDVILCDYRQPQFDGLRALRLLRERELDVPFIIVSGTIGEDVAVEVMQQGADDYLLKDRLTRLGMAVTGAIDQKQLRDAKRRADAALRESEARFRAVFEKAAVGIVRRGLDGRHLESNAALQQMLGYTGAELSAMGPTDFTHADDAAADRSCYEELIAGKRDFYRMEKRYVRKDGRLLWGDVTVSLVRDAAGRPQFAIAMIEDITERKKAEADLRALNEALEQRVADRTRELRARNEQMEADLAIAREFQLAFLPRQLPAFPAGATPDQSALQFCSRYQSSGAVGGDFYDILTLSETQAGVFLCDVMGHGTRAALVTAIIRGLLEELKPLATEPGRLLTEINRELIKVLPRADMSIFATAVYLVADVQHGCLRYACAGHPRPLHLRRRQQAVSPLTFGNGAAGPVLGLFVESAYASAECAVATDDLILLFTDGLYEVPGATGEFGPDRLLEAVRRRVHLPTKDLLDELLREVTGFSETGQFVDDVCIVGMDVARLGKAAA